MQSERKKTMAIDGTLLQIISEGTLDELHHMLNERINVDECNDKGQTPLMQPMHIDKAKALIEYGADVFVKDHKGMTALHHAALRANYLTSFELIRKGLDPFELDNDGVCALTSIADHDDHYSFKWLVNKIGGISEEKARESINNRAYMDLKLTGRWYSKEDKKRGRELLRAIKHRNVNQVRTILEQPLIELYDADGNTPIVSALYSGKEHAVELCTLLREAGASLGVYGGKIWTAFECACEYALPEIAYAIDPEASLSEPVKRRISQVLLVDDGNYSAYFCPTSKALKMSFGQRYPRGQEGGGMLPGAKFLECGDTFVKATCLEWFMPFLQDYVNGKPVIVADLEKDYKERTGDELSLIFTPSYESGKDDL